MSEQARALRAAFECANDELIRAVEGCSDEEWRAVTGAEGWSVGVVTHHIAEDHALLTSWTQLVAAGKTAPSVGPEALAAFNAQHAQQHAACTKAEAIALLRENGARTGEIIGGFSDAHLATAAPAFGQPAMVTRDIVEHILIGHIREHLASIRQALAETSSVAERVAASR